jgi:hypothetical protein
MKSGSIPRRPTLLHSRVCRGGERHRNGSPQQNACQTFLYQPVLLAVLAVLRPTLRRT